ncbi:MAG TPA: class I SAM-dependent methyltransferase [Thermoanaerobaculia bacterium]|nr:class I SAM-dependent methyltransferase [Thermoanaerobaculia bacterium]
MSGPPDARQFWDREILEQSHVSWLEHPLIRAYVNEQIGGWPFDWFERWLGGRRFERALSIGCGAGALERDLVRRGICANIDAFDGSVGSLRLARQEAVASGMAGRIRYFASNFNEPVLPRRKYDLVLFHQSAHHVAKLEKLYRALLRSMKSDAILYLDEYVGPSRHDWSDELLAEHRRVFASLPREVRDGDALPYPIQDDDPSEAIRSSEIEHQLVFGFKTLERRPYGGTLLSVIFPRLRPGAGDDVVRRLIDEEKRMLREGHDSYYKIIVARPRRGLLRPHASLHYFAVPKLKRVVREIKRSIASK